jgi:signal transduction histidine kinase
VRGLLVVGLISVLMALVAALVLATSVTRPLRRLRTATEHLAAGEDGVQAPDDDGPPEVRSLARSFNTMSTRLSTLLAAQRSFAGDASHQLRTPLTALRLRLEQASELVDHDPREARVRLEAATAETERLQHVVDQLLMLARTEGRSAERVVVDLAAVARERATMWEPLAAEQDVVVTADAMDGSALVLAAPHAVEQVIDNYLDNALRVAPVGSSLDVVVVREGSGVAVRVLDRGPGMTAEQRAHAFDRFWRAPDAASGGSGLGLAIVQRLVEASGGSVALEARAGGGTVASAVFPAAPTA